MAVKTRIEPLDRDVNLIIDELLSPAARSRQFAEGAKQFLDEADETNRQVLGRIPRNQTYVDGRKGAPLPSVRPDGFIVREYELVMDVLFFIATELQRASPVGKGDSRPGHPGFYRASHRLFADGAEVPMNTARAGEVAISTLVPHAEQYIFLSDAPYTRRVERRHEVYERTAIKAVRRFGNIAKVRFGWQSPVLSYVAGAANRAERARDRATQPRAKWAAQAIERETRVPAIIVTIGR